MKNILSILTVLLLTAMATQVADAQKPNIIFIFCDDLGYGDVGFNGSKLNRTPNMDLLAKNGIRFTDCYAAANVCSPSRAALMTGQYPVRTGITNVIQPYSAYGIRKESITMAEMLKDAGYHTKIIGKWHLGDSFDYYPLQHGFDEFLGTSFSNHPNPTQHMRGNEVIDKNFDKSQFTQLYTKETLKYIEDNKSRPFFLYLSQCMPHIPLAASKDFLGKSNNGLYGDVIEELDWSVGEIVKKLRECKLEENTIIVFSSDNGPWLKLGKNGGIADPLYEGKFTTWEGGHREPTFVYWKNKIKPRVHTGMITLMDWFPTFATIAGGKIPTDRIIDGEDISKVLFKNGNRKNEAFFFFSGPVVRAYRSGDYKILKNADKIKAAQLGVSENDMVMFNLRNDIHEDHDLSKTNPQLLESMVLKMKDFEKSIEGLETFKDKPNQKKVKNGSN